MRFPFFRDGVRPGDPEMPEGPGRQGAGNRRRGAAKLSPSRPETNVRTRARSVLTSFSNLGSSQGLRSDSVPVGPADALLTGAIVALIAFGVVMVYSASAVFAHARFDNAQHYLIRQSIFALAGGVVIVALARIDYHSLRRFMKPFLMLSTLLLVATYFGFGRSAGGAARWIRLGPVNIQPAEIVKIAMIGWLSYSLSTKADRIRSFSIGMAPHLLVAGVVALLCYKQPDLGSAVMIGLITFVLLFTAGARIGYILGLGLLLLPVGYLAVIGREYRMRRITAFLDPFAHRFDEGYQIAESLMSFGAGGVHGVGIGDSRQKLFFLPEAHTDFISAIVGEELGLVGFVGLVCLFLLVLFRGARAAYFAADDYGTYLAMGVTMFIGMQAFTNLAVAVSLLPTKGLVLPFVSYGGSALLVNCAAVGVLLNVSRPRKAVSSAPNGAVAGFESSSEMGAAS